jgi:hypothetical protein
MAISAASSPKMEKFPVNFPVSREFGSGDGFDCDCVRHHPQNRALILQIFFTEVSNARESLTVDVRYLAFSIADSASRR